MAPVIAKRGKPLAIKGGVRHFRQADLVRALRAFKKAGIEVGHVAIFEDHISVEPALLKIAHHTPYLSMSEACAYGKFGRTRAYELIAQGKLRVKKFGVRTLVSKASIEKLLSHLPRELDKPPRVKHRKRRRS